MDRGYMSQWRKKNAEKIKEYHRAWRTRRADSFSAPSTAELSAKRRCTKCGEVKSVESFKRDKRCPMGRAARCKQCKNSEDRATPERIRRIHARYIDWKARNKSHAMAWRRAWQKEWRRNNPDKVSVYRAHAASRVTNCYVKHLLKNGTVLKNSDIPPELVRIKRAHILLKRSLKTKTNAQ